ncbi:MAG: hypothetical protein EKK61_03605 [Rickettsiales bacterium]|nr:MAG: hypothetical protein EKK61_03605 [Rickettsiales bacterium]
MNKTQAKSFLKGLGLKSEQIEKLVKHIPADAEESSTEDLDAAHESISQHQIELFQNSETYKTAIKKAADWKLGETNEKAIKKIKLTYGLTDDEIKDKKFDEVVDLAFKKASLNSNKGVEEVQAELRKVSDELKKVKEEEIPAIQSQVEKEKKKFLLDNAVTKTVGGLKLRKGVDLEDAMILVYQKADRNGYKVDIDEKNNIIFTDKEGNKIKSQDQKNFLTSSEILNTLLEGHIEKSGAPEQKPGQTVIVEKTEKTELGKGLGSTIQENLSTAQQFLEQKRAARQQ